MTINAGSSSVRLAAFHCIGREHWQRLAQQRQEKSGEPAEILHRFMQQHALESMNAVAHRIVHGGEHLRQSRLLDAGVEAEIESCSVLAPLHNPVALRWVSAARRLLPAAEQVAVFDTAYYAELPDVARHYALPSELTQRWHLQRYGFHGLAHAAMNHRWRGLRGTAGGRVISLQLGAGCSITASIDGVARDTSMGFSPLEGLVMASRGGDIDPGLITYLQRQEGLSVQSLERLLNEDCGLRGLSGISGDMRELLASGDSKARLAVDLYCYRARKYIGAYLAVLGGVDAVLFGGGVGENQPEVRARILSGMEWAGIWLDAQANAEVRGIEQRISTPDSRAQIWVIPVDEARLLAEKARTVMTREQMEHARKEV